MGIKRLAVPVLMMALAVGLFAVESSARSVEGLIAEKTGVVLLSRDLTYTGLREFAALLHAEFASESGSSSTTDMSGVA